MAATRTAGGQNGLVRADACLSGAVAWRAAATCVIYLHILISRGCVFTVSFINVHTRLTTPFIRWHCGVEPTWLHRYPAWHGPFISTLPRHTATPTLPTAHTPRIRCFSCVCRSTTRRLGFYQRWNVVHKPNPVHVVVVFTVPLDVVVDDVSGQ